MKHVPVFLIIMGISSFAMAQTSNNHRYNLLIGTYTNAEKTNGIHVYDFNTETGACSEKFTLTAVRNPSYLAISRDKKNVYAVSESGDGQGSVSAYSFDPESGKLILLNTAGTGGNGPCYVSVDDKKQFVFVGNYGAGSLSAIRVKKDGSLTSDVQTIRHEGHSVNKNRQDKPHVHAVVLSPDERYLLTPDLGTDKVNLYRFDPRGPQPLLPASPAFADVAPGGGPRHLTFHPNGKYAYLILEMAGGVQVFDYKDGKLEARQSITMLAPDFVGRIGAADIHISPDGKFLYASNRGEANEVVFYSIANDGTLAYAGRQPDMIDTPRNFAIDPTGNFLLVANQKANDIVIFRRDKQTGSLTATGKKILVDKPVCLKFVAVD